MDYSYDLAAFSSSLNERWQPLAAHWCSPLMEDLAKPLLQSLPRDFRAVIIGASGGIGAAVSELVMQQPNVGEVVTFSRSRDGFDLLEERSVAEGAESMAGRPIHLLFCATGMLTTAGHAPEKSVRQIDPEVMLAQFRTNAVGPALVAKHFLPLLDRNNRSLAAFLSARVGSIGDNRLGGWASYRSSKAALNQIVRTVAIESRRTHPEAVIVALHPGTVRTPLSEPYSRGHASFSSQEAAVSMLTSLDALSVGNSGSFVAYDGSSIPW